MLAILFGHFEALPWLKSKENEFLQSTWIRKEIKINKRFFLRRGRFSLYLRLSRSVSPLSLWFSSLTLFLRFYSVSPLFFFRSHSVYALTLFLRSLFSLSLCLAGGLLWPLSLSGIKTSDSNISFLCSVIFDNISMENLKLRWGA
jgi:hypothetical protein